MKSIAATLATIFLTGCISSHMKYPAAWAPLSSVEKDTCPSITGKYQIVSEPRSTHYSCKYIGRGHSCRSLAEELIGEDVVLAQHSWLEIEEIGEVELKVTTSTDAISEDTLVTSEKVMSFGCNENGVIVKVSGEFRAEDGAIGFNSGFRKYFLTASDGSLVMKETSSGGGLVFVVPVAGSSMEWWKWQPIK